MPKIKISRSSLARIEPPSATVYYFDTALPGFAIRVSPKGLIAYLAQGYCHGTKHRKTLGRHPSTTPEQARAAALSFLSALSSGKAPLRSARMADQLDAWLEE